MKKIKHDIMKLAKKRIYEAVSLNVRDHSIYETPLRKSPLKNTVGKIIAYAVDYQYFNLFVISNNLLPISVFFIMCQKLWCI